MSAAKRSLACLIAGVLSLPAYALDLNVDVLNADGSSLGDVIVYAEPLDGQQLAVSNEVINIGQKGKTFAPYVSVAQTGSGVLFDNQDDITHHIYSVDGDARFSFKIKAGQQRLQQGLNSSGEIAMGCNIHDWMSGYILLVDTPLFAKTKANGVANLNVPVAGRYRVGVWHPQINAPENRQLQVVDINADTRLQMRLERHMDEIPSQESDDDFDFISDY